MSCTFVIWELNFMKKQNVKNIHLKLRQYSKILISFNILILLYSCGESDPILNNPPAALIDPAVNYSISGTSFIVADGVQESVITINLIDSKGNAIIDTIPEYSATDTESKNIYSTCSATDAAGTSICKLKSTKAESKVIKLTSPHLKIADNKIDFIPNAETHMIFSTAVSTEVIPGQIFPQAPLIRIYDDEKNFATLSTSTLTIAAYSDSVCNTKAGGNLTADLLSLNAAGTGQYQFSNIKYDTAGTIYLGVSATSGIDSLCSAAISLSGNLSYSAIFATQPSISVGAGVSLATQPVIEIRDQFNALINSSDAKANLQITLKAFSDSACTQAASGILRGDAIKSSVQGSASGFLVNYTKVETIYLQASAIGLTATCSNNIIVAIGPAYPENSTITGTGVIAANNFHASVITITLKDEFGNIVPGGSAPTFKALNGSNENSNTYGACSIPDAAGVATCSLKSSAGEIKTLQIVTPVVKAGGNVTFINPPDAANTTITGTTTIADGSDLSIITIYLLDSNSNPVVGLTPAFSATDTGSTNVQGNCSVSDQDGKALCALLSTYAENKALSLSSPLVMVGDSALFTAGAPVASKSSIIGSTSIVADLIESSSITITLKDSYNNVATGISGITFAATDTNNTNTYGTCSTSNSSGVATCSLKSKVAELKTLSITNPFTKTGGEVLFIAGPKAKIAFVTQPSTTAIAGENFSTAPIIEMRDQYDNVLISSTDLVTIVAYTMSDCTTAGLGTLNGISANANGTNGRASFSAINYNKKEVIYLKASSDGFTSCSEATNVSAANVATVTITSNQTNIVANGSATASLSCLAKDQYSNTVLGQAITLSIPSDGGTVSSPNPTSTDTDGIASFTLVSSTVANTYTYNCGVLSNSTNITFDPGAVSNISFAIKAGSAAAIGADGISTTMLEATVTDFYSNVVPAISVSVNIPTNGGSIGGSSLSDAAGVATFTLTSSTTFGTYSYTAQDNQTTPIISTSLQLDFVSPNVQFEWDINDYTFSRLGPSPLSTVDGKTFTLTNIGAMTSGIITGYTISGSGKNAFSIITDNCINTTLSYNQSCTIYIEFNSNNPPTKGNLKNADYSVTATPGSVAIISADGLSW